MLTFEEIDLKSIHGSDKKGWGVNYRMHSTITERNILL
jgi:hypothetical protein